eukprot:scaffold246427_cov63-Attheya_sp.AAC.1
MNSKENRTLGSDAEEEHWVKKLTSYFKYCVRCPTGLAMSVKRTCSYCVPSGASVSRPKNFGPRT